MATHLQALRRIGDNGGPAIIDDPNALSARETRMLRHIDALHRALEDKRLGACDRKVLAVIGGYMDWDTGEAYPGRDLIAELTGYKVGTVANAIANLVKLNVIKAVFKKPATGGRPLMHYSLVYRTREEIAAGLKQMNGLLMVGKAFPAEDAKNWGKGRREGSHTDMTSSPCVKSYTDVNLPGEGSHTDVNPPSGEGSHTDMNLGGEGSYTAMDSSRWVGKDKSNSLPTEREDTGDSKSAVATRKANLFDTGKPGVHDDGEGGFILRYRGDGGEITIEAGLIAKVAKDLGLSVAKAHGRVYEALSDCYATTFLIKGRPSSFLYGAVKAIENSRARSDAKVAELNRRDIRPGIRPGGGKRGFSA